MRGAALSWRATCRAEAHQGSAMAPCSLFGGGGLPRLGYGHVWGLPDLTFPPPSRTHLPASTIMRRARSFLVSLYIHISNVMSSRASAPARGRQPHFMNYGLRDMYVV